VTVTRRNILDSQEARDRFLEGVVELDQPTEITALNVLTQLRAVAPWFRMSGVNQQLSGSTRPSVVGGVVLMRRGESCHGAPQRSRSRSR
jgi:hypothetical protein